MCSILLAYEINYPNDPKLAQKTDTFYNGLVTIASNNKVVELLGKNTLLIALNDDGSLEALHEIFSLANHCTQTLYKHVVLNTETQWHDVKQYLEIKKSLQKSFG